MPLFSTRWVKFGVKICILLNWTFVRFKHI